MAFALGIVACLDPEEVFDGAVQVHVGRQVGQVIAELHGFGVQLAVGPLAQHRNLGVGIGLGALAQAGVVEVAQPHALVGLGGVEVLRHAHVQRHFRAAVVVHGHLQGAQGAVVAADGVVLGCPVAGGRSRGARLGIGAVDETVVAPVAPGVHHDPCAHLVLVGLAVLAVAVQVELDAVVIAHDGERVVHAVAPFLHVVFAHHAQFLVGGGGANLLPVAAGSHADAHHAACRVALVAAVVPQVVLQQFAPLLGVHGGEVGAVGQAVVHGMEPLVVALHPAVVALAVVAVLVAEGFTIGLAAIHHAVGDAGVLCQDLLALTAHPCEQPREVGGVDVLGQLAVGVACGVDLMREHVVDARCRPAGTCTLVHHGREGICVGIVPVVWPGFALGLAGFDVGFGPIEPLVVEGGGGVVVGIGFTVPLHGGLGMGRQKRAQHQGGQKDSFHIVGLVR